MPNSKAKKAERKKAAEDLEEGVDSDFEERQELQEKVYGLATKMCGNLKWSAVSRTTWSSLSERD